MRALGAELDRARARFSGGARGGGAVRRARGLHTVPSFHRDLVLGVATYSLELLRDHPDLDVLYVPIGLGSGICGGIAARDALGLKTEIVGVQSTRRAGLCALLRRRPAVTTSTADTHADGMATRVPDAEALEVIAKGAARITLVSDDEIAARDPRLLDRYAQSR